MKFFPILDELISSDSVILLIIGLVIALIIGIMVKSVKKNMKLSVGCLAVYLICEILSNIRTNYMLEILLLLLGTAALGGMVAFAGLSAVRKFKKK